MKDDTSLLKELAQERDIISLGVCVSIYQTCNGVQFRNMPASDFVNFLNLKLSKVLVTPLPREKQRICYMIYAVSRTIDPANFSKYWIEGILDLCNISLEYYQKHHKDALSVKASKKNKEYREYIDEAIERGRNS